MFSKRHNDPVHWKHTLETPEYLPQITVAEKDVLWNRLNSRLLQNINTNKAIWYWLAAAMIPLAFIVLTMPHARENTLLTSAPVSEKNIHATTTVLLPALKESVSVFVSPPVETGKSEAGINTKPIIKIPVDTIRAGIAIETVIAPPEKAASVSTFTNAPSIDTFTAITVAKNKLQVVHINELETLPAGFTAPVNYAQNLSEKTRKNKANNLTITTQQNSIGFKIKLSSKN